MTEETTVYLQHMPRERERASYGVFMCVILSLTRNASQSLINPAAFTTQLNTVEQTAEAFRSQSSELCDTLLL